MKYPPQVNQVYWIYKIDFGALKNQHIDPFDKIYIRYIKVKVKSVHAWSLLFSRKEDNVDLVGLYDDDDKGYFLDMEFNRTFDRIFDTKEGAQIAVKERLQNRCIEIQKKIDNQYQKLKLYEEAVITVMKQLVKAS